MSWRITLIVLLSVTVLQVDADEFKLSDQFASLKYADPDSIGYRHCAYWELADGTHLHSDCDPHTMDRCGRPFKFQYKCCAGFEEDPKAFVGYGGHRPDVCSRVVSPFTTCPELVLQSPDNAAFAPLLSSVSELRLDDPQEPYTIFAPVLGDDENPPTSAEHVVKGRFYVSDLKHGLELETLEGQRTLYVSKFPYGVTAVDCADITDADLECQNGIVHKIRQPFGGRSVNFDADRSSLMSFLRSNPETASFAEDLPPDLKRALEDVRSGKRYTVLVPRTQSWDTLKQRYTGPKLQKIASAHVLPGQICSGNLISTTNIKLNVQGDRVNIQCEISSDDGSEKRYVLTDCGERRSLVEADMTAANGVVHLIDQPMIPLSALTLNDLKDNEQCTSKLKITEFMKLLKECDLFMEDGEQYAMIVPQDESFLWWSTYEPFKEEYKRFQVDQEYRCRVARYHVVKSNERLKNIDTLSGHTMGHRTNNKGDYLYETTYFTKTAHGSQLNFHYAPIPDMRAKELDDVSMYFSTKINVPPEKNMTEILESRPDTKILFNKTMEVDMNGKHFSKNAPKNLYLVTTDDGWKDPRASPGSVSPFRPEYTMYKGDVLEKFLLLHHVPLYLWGGDIGYFPKNSVHRFPSSAGTELIFWRDEAGVMRIGLEGTKPSEWPKVVKWNIPARDGMIWLLDGILKCPETICPLFVEDIDYYDMYVSACQTSQLPNEPNAAADFNKKPTDVASRHPDVCTVIWQLSETSVNLIEAGTKH